MPATKRSTQLSIGRIASLACLLEICATKPGNVHRGADFADTTFNDFAVSAELFGHAIDNRATDELGLLILNGVESTQSLVDVNTNLGIILLISPLAILANDGDLSEKTLRQLLKSTTVDDAANIYKAIKLAAPGGLGDVAAMDVNDNPPENILEAMRFSSDQDQIAQAYSNNFQQVFADVVPLLEIGLQQFNSVNEAIIYAHVSMIARYGDSLIKRKCGVEASDHAQMLACKALEALVSNDTQVYYDQISALDFWLRADGNKRNPGTTADLITAGLFVAIINEKICAPFN